MILNKHPQKRIFQGYNVVIFLYVLLLQFATIHRGERDENWSNKEVLIALLWATSLSRARPSTETIAILSRHVVHCTIIKYDDAALLFNHLLMATIGESRSPISSLSLSHPRDRVPTKRSTRLPTPLRGGSPNVIRDDLCFDSTINNDLYDNCLLFLFRTYDYQQNTHTHTHTHTHTRRYKFW